MPKDVSLTSSKTSPSCVGCIDVMPAGGIDVMPADCIDVMPTGCIDVLPAGCMTGIPFTQATGLLPAAISSLRTTGSFPNSVRNRYMEGDSGDQSFGLPIRTVWANTASDPASTSRRLSMRAFSAPAGSSTMLVMTTRALLSDSLQIVVSIRISASEAITPGVWTNTPFSFTCTAFETVNHTFRTMPEPVYHLDSENSEWSTLTAIT